MANKKFSDFIIIQKSKWKEEILSFGLDDSVFETNTAGDSDSFQANRHSSLSSERFSSLPVYQHTSHSGKNR